MLTSIENKGDLEALKMPGEWNLKLEKYNYKEY